MNSDMVMVPRAQLEMALARARVFDDGTDGADAESARSVVAILVSLLAAPAAQVVKIGNRKEMCREAAALASAIPGSNAYTGAELLYDAIANLNAVQPGEQQDEPVGYRSRFRKEPNTWMVKWGSPLPADKNPAAEYQLLYTHPRPAAPSEEEPKLRGLCAELYQILGALDAPARVLDKVSAAANGEPVPDVELLPFVPEALSEEEERAHYDKWRTPEAGYAKPFNRYEWDGWKARAALARGGTAQRQNASPLLQALARVADGSIAHLGNGLCPDALEGHDSRDPDCPACQALVQFDRLALAETPAD